nr:phage tail tube protein [uncultured Roseovarius sp.]
MSGTAASQIRSAYVSESAVGTIPATPSFNTLHQAAQLAAKPNITYMQSLTGGGARTGQGYNHTAVDGSLESQLVYGVFDDLLATLLQSTWQTNVIKDGKAETTVAIENTIPAGVGGASTMLRFRGVEATSGTLRLKADEAAQLSLTLMGRGSDDATTTALSGATYTDPTKGDPMTSGADVGTIAFSTYTLDCMESLDIAFEFEGRERQPRIASNDLCGITRGNFLPTLTANMYIEANFMAIYNAARSTHTAFSVTVPLGSVSGDKYTIVFPVCRFGSTEIDQSGTNIMQNVEIVPYYDGTTEDAVVKITRAVS